MSRPAAGTRTAVAASAATLLWARFAVAILAMAFVAVSTRLLSLREMAVFAVYHILCSIQPMVCSLGLFTTATREVPDMMGRGDLDGVSRLMKTALAANTLLSAILAGGLAAGARPLSLLFLKDVTFVAELRLAAAAVFLWNLFEASQLLLVAAQRFGKYSRSNLVCAVAQKVLALTGFALLHARGHALMGYLVGFALGTLTGAASGFRALADLLRRRAGFAPLRPLLKYSAPFYADGYLRYLYMQADQLIIGVFLTPEILSLYFIAKRFSQYYQQMVSSSVDPVLAKVAEIRSRGREAVESTLRSASRYFTLVFIPFTAGAISMSAFFLDLAGGSAYRSGALVLAFLSLSVAFSAAFNLVTGYLYVLGVPTDRLKYNAATGVSQIALMGGFLTAARWLSAGPIVVAAAIALARSGAMTVGLAYAHVRLRSHIRPSYDLDAGPRCALASLLMAAVILVLQAVYAAPLAVLAYGLAGLGVFVMVVRPAVREEDMKMLDGILSGRAAPLGRLARRIFGLPGGRPAEA